MLPSQATGSLRWILRPCLRYSQSALSTAAVLKLSPHKLTSADVPALSLDQQLLASYHGPRTFSTSCARCEIVREPAEDAEKKLLKFENGEKAQAIMSASFEELMKLASKVESGFLACLVLQRLSALCREEGGSTELPDGETLLQDPRLTQVSQQVDKNITRLSPKVILTTLQALYQITPADAYIVKSLVMQVLWMVRRLPMSVLVQALQIHLRHQETPLRESVVQQIMTVLERRWVELSSVKDVVFLMYNMQSSPVNQTLMERLEDRALDLVETATPKELYRIIYLLSRQRHRNTPLIRAVVYHLNKTSLASLSTVQLTNLVYALCILRVYDTTILAKISAELGTKRGDMTVKLASSLLVSFSRLRWKESSVTELILDVVDGNLDVWKDAGSLNKGKVLDSLDASDKVSLIISLANLNVDTPRSRAMVEKVVGDGDVQGLQQSSPLLWLDVVWSLAVLRMLDGSSASSVLAEDFWRNLPASDSFQSVVNLTKVNNINSAARFEVEGYTGPFLPPAMTTGDAKLLQKGERNVAEKVVAALTNMAPLESYTLVNTTAPGGFLLDAEFYVDSSGAPKPLSQVSQGSSDLHRVALKVLDFPDLTLPTSDSTGLQAMAVRHLGLQGYTVVQVHHTEVSSKAKVVELVQLVQQKVKDALKVTLTSQSGS